jgi:hypothetical protein
MKRKTKDALTILIGIGVLGVASNSLLAFPTDAHFRPRSEGHLERDGRREHGGFLLGVCVGETLAGQGASYEQAGEAAVQSVTEGCRANRGNEPSPSPSSSAMPQPSQQTTESASTPSSTPDPAESTGDRDVSGA